MVEGPEPRHRVTRLLAEWRGGRERAREELWPLVYDELRRIAARQMSDERAGHTLQTTGLVHEAYVRLVDSEVEAAGRAEFLGLAARAMRNILIDHARRRRRDKRGGGVAPLTLDEALAAGVDPRVDLLDLDRALERLAAQDARKGRAVELHFFAGLTHEQIAEALDVSVSTVRGDLRFARAWLASELESGGDGR